MTFDSYVNLTSTFRARVRAGAMPTLQIEDSEGSMYSINVTGTSGQLRDIKDVLVTYLAEKDAAAAAAMTTKEVLRNAG